MDHILIFAFIVYSLEISGQIVGLQSNIRWTIRRHIRCFGDILGGDF